MRLEHRAGDAPELVSRGRLRRRSGLLAEAAAKAGSAKADDPRQHEQACG